MKKGREFLNKPVFDTASGKLLGYVGKIVIVNNDRMTGINVSLPGENMRFIPFFYISSIGRDAVLVDLTRAEKEKEPDGSGSDRDEEKRDFTGFNVMTAAGQTLGTVEDIVVAEQDGSILGYELSDGLVKDMVMGRKVIPVSSILSFGDDAVIVKDSE